MNPRIAHAFVLGGVFLLISSGCANRIDHQTFPMIWPSSVSLPVPKSGPSQPESGPMILVDPVRYGDFDEADMPATVSVLTDLLAQRLQIKGIAARTSPAQAPSMPARLQCGVEKLTYTRYSHYPATTVYEAELSCSLEELGLKRPRWTQKLAQRFEKIEIVNTMTKLPSQHEKILFEECILPLWDAMAVGLKTFMEYAPDASSSAVVEPDLGREQPQSETTRQIYSK